MNQIDDLFSSVKQDNLNKNDDYSNEENLKSLLNLKFIELQNFITDKIELVLKSTITENKMKCIIRTIINEIKEEIENIKQKDQNDMIPIHSDNHQNNLL